MDINKLNAEEMLALRDLLNKMLGEEPKIEPKAEPKIEEVEAKIEVKVEEPKIEPKAEPKKRFTKLDLYRIMDEIVLVQNLSDSIVIYKSKDGFKTKWAIGACEAMAIKDILQMDTHYKKMYWKYLKPLDDRVIEGLNLSYDDIELFNDITSLIDKPLEELENIIKNVDSELVRDKRKALCEEIKKRDFSYSKIKAYAKLLGIHELDLC